MACERKYIRSVIKDTKEIQRLEEIHANIGDEALAIKAFRKDGDNLVTSVGSIDKINKARKFIKDTNDKYGKQVAKLVKIALNKDKLVVNVLPLSRTGTQANLAFQLPENQVNYVLKSANALQSDKVRNPKNNLQGFYNDLQKQGVPNQQIEIIKSLNPEGKTKEELLTELLANYSYTVEINTAKNKIGIDLEGNEVIEETQYYSNLTVPGGTNYTENEISTPLITPSIKGHAQFSTDNGIGWFRSDEQISGRSEDFDEFYYQEETGGHEYPPEQRFKTRREYVGKEFGSKTRRILELQSDLFQKGRDKDDLITSLEGYGYSERVDYSTGEQFYQVGRQENMGEVLAVFNNKEDAINFIKENEKQDKIKKENQFLQLLNKDNNWVKFFIQSIIQDTAKQTVTEVQESDVEAKVRELENSGLLKIKCD